MILIPIQVPEDVWDQPDEAYRWPLLSVRVGDTKFDHHSKVQVREATFTLAAKRTRIDFNIVVFDPTMVELARLLKLNRFSGTGNKLAVSFGWNFPGGFIPERNGTMEGITQNITPDGFNYNIRGFINYNTVAPPDTELQPLALSNVKISDVVRAIVTEVLGMDANSITIQETLDDYGSTHLPPDVSVTQFLDYLADEATKYLPQEDSNNPERFRSVFDIFGRYHFHTDAYEKERLAEPRVSVRWPYPEPNRPVIEFSVSDVEWAVAKLRSADIDQLTGQELFESQGIVSGGAAISIPVKLPPSDSGTFTINLTSVAKALSDRDMYADIVLMGNIYIELGDMIRVDVIAPIHTDIGITQTKIEHLSGLWFVQQVTHNVTDAGFVTRLNIRRYWEANKDVVLN